MGNHDEISVKVKSEFCKQYHNAWVNPMAEALKESKLKSEEELKKEARNKAAEKAEKLKEQLLQEVFVPAQLFISNRAGNKWNKEAGNSAGRSGPPQFSPRWLIGAATCVAYIYPMKGDGPPRKEECRYIHKNGYLFIEPVTPGRAAYLARVDSLSERVTLNPNTDKRLYHVESNRQLVEKILFE